MVVGEYMTIFYRASYFSGKRQQVTFDSTSFLTIEEVLEMLGVKITEEVVSLLPEFTKFLKRSYVGYMEGANLYLTCPNYIDYVIRFFEYELRDETTGHRYVYSY